MSCSSSAGTESSAGASLGASFVASPASRAASRARLHPRAPAVGEVPLLGLRHDHLHEVLAAHDGAVHVALLKRAGGERAVALAQAQHVYRVALLGVPVERRRRDDLAVLGEEVPPRLGAQHAVDAGAVADGDGLPPRDGVPHHLLRVVDFVLARHQEAARGGLTVAARAHVRRNLLPVRPETPHQRVHDVTPALGVGVLVEHRAVRRRRRRGGILLLRAEPGAEHRASRGQGHGASRSTAPSALWASLARKKPAPHATDNVRTPRCPVGGHADSGEWGPSESFGRADGRGGSTELRFRATARAARRRSQ